MNIRKLNLFCPLDGQKLQKYRIDSEILEQCYGYCKKCKREYTVTVPKDGYDSVDFWWTNDGEQMRDILKRRVK